LHIVNSIKYRRLSTTYDIEGKEAGEVLKENLSKNIPSPGIEDTFPA